MHHHIASMVAKQSSSKHGCRRKHCIRFIILLIALLITLLALISFYSIHFLSLIQNSYHFNHINIVPSQFDPNMPSTDNRHNNNNNHNNIKIHIYTDSSLRLPTFFSDHMVLQSGPTKKARVWGWGTVANNKITVTISQRSSFIIRLTAQVETIVGNDLTWSVYLPPIDAGSGYEISISEWNSLVGPNNIFPNFAVYDDDHDADIEMEEDNSDISKTIETKIVKQRKDIILRDVAFGNVFLCSGQSNMEFRFSAAFESKEFMMRSYPHIRMVTLSRFSTDIPQTDAGVRTGKIIWTAYKPGIAFDTVSNDIYSYPSAVCTFFAVELTNLERVQQLKKYGDAFDPSKHLTPIGVLSTSWGGQPIETFSSLDALNDQTCGGIGYETAMNMKFPKEDIFVHTSRTVAEGRAQIWNGQIHPLLQMTLSGFVWYQGETNSGAPIEYACRFPAMIQDWRKKFGDMDLGFVFVQIAATQNYNGYASLREAQMVALKLKNTCSAIAIDIGDPTSNYGQIHPRRKREVGRRAALCMAKILSTTSDDFEKKIIAEGPTALNATAKSGNSILITFKINVPHSFHSAGTGGCTSCCSTPPFEISTSSNKAANIRAANTMDDRDPNEDSWQRVPKFSIESSGEYAFVTLSELPVNAKDVKIIRYAWEAAPECSLYDGTGGPDDHSSLPVAPFKITLSK